MPRQGRLGGFPLQPAAAVGRHIAYQVYQRLENPRKANPTIKTLEKIAKVFGRRVDLGLV
ncbi:helix-turn-helix domain-containing protein [Geomonas agri]|uniref:helix-turn-helix domain-containing protein n=1 Tax=Geomonas agri TaxID=2873702 RepID=UPI001CD56F5D|nr:helix-turn-helix transcriptional regulator [Geomonas agri]